MYIPIKRLFDGNTVVGYEVLDKYQAVTSMSSLPSSENTQRCSVAEFKQLVASGQVLNCKLQGDSVTGINGFSLRDLPSQQLKEKQKECDIVNIVFKRDFALGKQYSIFGANIRERTGKKLTIDRKELIRRFSESNMAYNLKLKSLVENNIYESKEEVENFYSAYSVQAVIGYTFDNIINRRISISNIYEDKHSIREVYEEESRLRPLVVVELLLYGESDIQANKNINHPNNIVGYHIYNTSDSTITIGNSETVINYRPKAKTLLPLSKINTLVNNDQYFMNAILGPDEDNRDTSRIKLYTRNIHELSIIRVDNGLGDSEVKVGFEVLLSDINDYKQRESSNIPTQETKKTRNIGRFFKLFRDRHNK